MKKYHLIFAIIISMIGMTACSSDDKKDDDDPKKGEKDAKEAVSDTQTYDFCTCMGMTLDAAEKSDSNPENLAKFKDELEPCEGVLAASQGDPQAMMTQMKDCPGMMQRIIQLSQKWT